METTGLTTEIQAQVERLQLQFIVTEIDTAWTFARSAQIMKDRGSTTNADRLVLKAWEAYSEAASHLRRSPIDADLRNKLTEKLNEIRLMLDTGPQQNAGIRDGKSGKR
jgi:hypothetical protein